MRRGRVYKRCKGCSSPVKDRRCARCGTDRTTWAFTVDTAPVGEPRKQTSKAGFPSKAEAVAAMNQLQAAKADGSHIEPSRETLGEYLASWIGAGAGGVRPWTLKGYTAIVRHHVTPTLGKVSLQKLTRLQLKAFYAELRRTGLKKGKAAGGPLSEKSVHNVHICLRAALNDAIEDGLIRTNPATGALKPPKAGQEMTTWTREELAAFLASVTGEAEHALYRVAAYTGLRRGELLGLRWSDVKWNLSQLSVQQQLGLDIDGDGTRDLVAVKTSNGRRAISLDAETLRILERQRAAQEFERRSWGEAYSRLGLVFCRPEGSSIDPDVVTGRFERLAAAAGLPRLRLHDLRHTHATMLLEAGVDISVVSARLGHANVGFTASVYAHVTARLQADAATKLSAYLEPASSL